MQYALEIGSVLAERVEQEEAGGFIGIRCVHMDGCCGSSRANTKIVLFSTCRGCISDAIVSCQSG